MAKTSIVLAGLLLLSPALVGAQQTVSKADSVTATATIQAIDATARRVTLKNEKGEEDTFTVGPEVTRFNELKVGDKVKMTYYESVVMQVRKPGEASTPPAADAKVNRSTGATPGATVAAQMTTTVTVKSIDAAVPSITVTTADGRTVTRKVEDKKNLENVKPGDRIDITYTQALLTSIQRAQ
jgi:Cu/Ag efflux protein CusF